MVLVRYDQHDRLLDDLSIRFHQSDLAARIRRVGIVLEAGRTLTRWWSARDMSVASGPAGVVASIRAARVAFSLAASSIGGGRHLRLDIGAVNESPGPVRLLRHVIELELLPPAGTTLEPADIRWFRNGWQSWSFSGVLSLASPRMAQPRFEWIRAIKEDPLVPASDAPFVSDMVAALRLGDNAICVGAADQSYFQRIRLEPARSPLLLTLEIDLDREPMHPGQERRLGSWQLEGEHTATYLVREWASRLLHHAAGAPHPQTGHNDAVGELRSDPTHQIPLPGPRTVLRHPTTPCGLRRTGGFAGQAPDPRPHLIGWCSWYDRKRNISHAYIRETVERIRNTPELSPMTTVIVDDGYQERVGDWLVPAARYGVAVSETARMISAAGLVPGIWVAPFIAQAGSEIMARHPDWVATRNGRPYRLGFNPHWRSTFYAMDIRNEEFLAHLTSVFARLYAAGFRVFKLDYLYPAALPLDRSPSGSGRFAAFRDAVAHIRRAVSKDSFLLGCGCPLAPAVGLFDGMRVSTDIDYCWKSPALVEMATGDEELVGIYPAVRNTLARSTFARDFWRVDPDCVLLARGRGTASQQEKNLFARLAALAGDVFLVGDDITRWGNEETAIFAEAMTRLGTRFIPLDAADRTDPTWAFAAGPAGDCVAAFNLGDRKEMLSVQLAHLRTLTPAPAAVETAPPVTARLHPDRIDVSPVESRASIVVDLRPSGGST